MVTGGEVTAGEVTGMSVPGGGRGVRSVAPFAWRLAFLLIAATALILGYLGLQQHLHGRSDYASDTWDLLYYDLQLFVLSPTPLQTARDIPPSLPIARFL